MKYAVFSMDIEDWYHIDYIDRSKAVLDYTMLDGLDRYLSILSENGIPSSFFVVGELIRKLAPALKGLSEHHDIGTHSWRHKRPLTMKLNEFTEEMSRCKETLENSIGRPVLGQRAPCFSLDRERLDVIREIGFKYDSSRILFGDHPLYGDINLDGYQRVCSEIFRSLDFFEFQVSTLPLAGKNIPVSGGGYLRIFPWRFMRGLLKRYLKTHDLYTLYIHPFELSSRANPPFPENTGWSSRIRFSLGRSRVETKLRRLIKLLKEEGYRFTTFSALRKQLMNG